MFIIKYRKIWFTISILLIGLSFYGFFAYGLNLSIDFKGGTLTEVRYQEPAPTLEDLNAKVASLQVGGFSVRPSGEDGFIIRTKELSQEEGAELLRVIGESNANYKIERQNTIGPIAGEELRSKSFKAITIVVLMIVLFVTFAFRKVTKPVSSWKYGLATIVALAHDVIIPTGVFIFLGYFVGIEIDLLFVTGLLAILGYSVHDTIVVFDRVRENLRINKEQNKQEVFEETVGKAVTQTMGRSINTSLTLLITLLALYFIGSSATENLTLLLIVGVVVGAYSSIFVASPLLVTFQKSQKIDK